MDHCEWMLKSFIYVGLQWPKVKDLKIKTSTYKIYWLNSTPLILVHELRNGNVVKSTSTMTKNCNLTHPYMLPNSYEIFRSRLESCSWTLENKIKRESGLVFKATNWQYLWPLLVMQIVWMYGARSMVWIAIRVQLYVLVSRLTVKKNS